ncbi:MAG: hypothetical protein MK179_02695 [Pirellulaceae bacterium]|nr:hypothetical protein [Pirellulaceae bacterium]
MEQSQIHFFDWCVVALYLVGIAAMGRYFARRQRDTQDFFLGGRQLPWMAVALSVMASLASTVGYLGDPGEIIQYGVGMLWRQVGLPFGAAMTILVIVPYFQRARVTTAFEILRQRFGTRMELIGVCVWAYMQVAFLGLVLLLASRLISQMTGVHNVLVISVIGLASLLYTSAGGMRSVVWTDVIQFCILASGAVVTLAVIAYKTGSGFPTWWHEVSGATHELPPWYSTDLTVRHTVLGAVLFRLVVDFSYNTSEQVVVQRYFATRRAKLMMLANYCAGAVFNLVIIFVGASLLFFYNSVEGALPAGVAEVTDPDFADRAFPYFIANHLPIGLTGLVIAALLGAAQSTIDSGLNSLTAVISRDIVPRFRKRKQEAEELRFARVMTRVIGTAVILMAIVTDNIPGSNNIVDLAQKVVHLGLGPMGAVFLAAMFLPYVGQRAVLIALFAGMLWALFYAFEWFGMDVLIVGEKMWWTSISPLLLLPGSFFVTAVTAAVLGAMLRDPSPT